ncbi:MAG: DegT/DnrJ/EryC1/StrS family aminotransferase [Paramuribaculum sp.]|nr:DegT/DnrJ/EryC1/StrS family aminotransferase [Paramuribaculum sp.]
MRMVDLYGQYLSVKEEMDAAIGQVMSGSAFVRGPQVGELESELAAWMGVGHCVTCGSGTDALMLAMTAIGIGPGDEVIVPAFTFGAVAESVALRGGIPVFADVDPLTFNMDPSSVERLISERTRAIVPVHLFGQPCDMPPLLELAGRHGLAVVEDNAQSLGAVCRSESCREAKAGGVGLIGCTSFFPTKVLGCYGDGGALFTDDEDLARRIRMIANHGQSPKYTYRVVGMNSRLDT